MKISMILNENGISYSHEPNRFLFYKFEYTVIHLEKKKKFIREIYTSSRAEFEKLINIWNNRHPDIWRYCGS